MQFYKVHLRKFSQLHLFLRALRPTGLDGSRLIARATKLMILVSGLLIVGCAGSGTETMGDLQPTPEIISVFACSKYCPGPDSIYRKRVYRGVFDKTQCQKLDGEMYSYGTNAVCVVK